MKRIAWIVLRSLAKVKILFTLVLLGGAFYLGTQLAAPPPSLPQAMPPMASAEEHAGHSAKAETIWTCSMHRQIKLSEPGLCPICRMDLIPLETGTSDNDERRLVMSQSDRRLAEIQTVRVERRFVNTRIRMVGTVDYDETRVKTISSYVPGRIDRLYIDYTGLAVKEGDRLVLIYSPELLRAQEELLEAKGRVETTPEQRSDFLRNSDLRALESAREKLRLYGLDEAQIRDIETRGSADDQVLIRSPQSGIVIEKSVNEGQYVQTGTQIYTVADLDRVWVMLDAYESDLLWLHYGQPVDLQSEAYPGEHFAGIIAFIDPVLDTRTRTVKLRVNVDNSDGRLKPGMFVRATVHARVAKAGKVIDPNLAGKWIAPMHPEIVRDGPGECPICHMDLVRAEDLGFVSPGDEEARPLVVPATAVLRTGTRAVVYIEVPNAELPTYEGREIVLGPRAGDYYLVKSGLSEGERVVTNGNFNIDSALQIMAMPSMLSQKGESSQEGGDFPTFRLALAPVFENYFNTQQHLANDQLAEAIEAATGTGALIDAVDMTLLAGDAHDTWMDAQRRLKRAMSELTSALDFDSAREAFAGASNAIIAIEKRFGHTGDASVVEILCPMAFGRGASWLQFAGDVRNPYYGARMLDCGDVTAEYSPNQSTFSTTPMRHQH